MGYNHYYSLRVSSSLPHTDKDPEIPLYQMIKILKEFATILGHSKKRPIWFNSIEKGSVMAVARVSEMATKESIDVRLSQARSWMGAGKKPTKSPPPAIGCHRLTKLLHEGDLQATIGSSDNIESRDFTTLLSLNTNGQFKQISFQQKGTLNGFIVRIGHSPRTPDVPVHLGNDAGDLYLCRARRALAHEMAAFPEKTVFRVNGEGVWSKEFDGTWRVRQFMIERFETLPFQQGFKAALERLRKTEFAQNLAGKEDPGKYLESLREEDLI